MEIFKFIVSINTKLFCILGKIGRISWSIIVRNMIQNNCHVNLKRPMLPDMQQVKIQFCTPKT